MSVYTKNGDGGETSLIGNARQSKSDLIFEVLGTLDELNSSIGILVSSTDFTDAAKDLLVSIQSDLFQVGALIANPKAEEKEYDFLSKKTLEIEYLIDDLETKLPRLKNFILPGGSTPASLAHLSRSICRRLERRIVLFNKHSAFSGGENCVSYVNRLSDFLYCLARYLNHSTGHSEIVWTN